MTTRLKFVVRLLPLVVALALGACVIEPGTGMETTADTETGRSRLPPLDGITTTAGTAATTAATAITTAATEISLETGAVEFVGFSVVRRIWFGRG